MWKRIAFLVLLIVVPIAVASLVQRNTSSRQPPREGPAVAPVITKSSGQTEVASLNVVADDLLDASAEAWNNGDLDGFLIWYERDPGTTYIGGSGLLHGWDAIRDRYAPLFEPGASKDSLRFEDLETRPLGPALGLATARYVLFDGDSITATGMFTLVLAENPAGWRIVHDHSSADSN